MQPVRGKTVPVRDWDALYRQGTPPWDAGRPHAELARVIEEAVIPRGSALEIGCGSGADAIFLARHGFDVTAVDVSPIAIERARARAEQHDALVRFVQEDIYQFARQSGAFDFVYDAGFYHFARLGDVNRLVDMLWRVTRPGSYYLCLAGAAGETSEGGPPQVSDAQIHEELGRLFETIHLRRCRLESSRRDESFAAWSCLMRRPMLAKK